MSSGLLSLSPNQKFHFTLPLDSYPPTHTVVKKLIFKSLAVKTLNKLVIVTSPNHPQSCKTLGSWGRKRWSNMGNSYFVKLINNAMRQKLLTLFHKWETKAHEVKPVL